MATIDQVIDIIPDAGHRGVDARTLFVTKQEAFQDAITDAFVPQLNTFRTEVNLLASEVNTLRAGTLTLRNETENIRNLANTQTQAQVALATTQAGIAITKASEASTSANQALIYKNQLQGYVVPAGASYSVEQINTQNSAMSKAQFLALCEERKANRAGSGWDEWGQHRANDGKFINQGMWTFETYPNYFTIGENNSPTGNSKTNQPYALINGVKLNLSNVNTATLFENNITLPTAPNIYPHDTVLTPEQIASGVIKHADSSNSGLIVNGKFNTDTSGWSVWKTSALSVISSRLNVNAIGVVDDLLIQPFSVVAAKTYIIELEKIQGNNVRISVGNSNTNYNGEQYLGSDNLANGKYVVNFTANVTATVYLKVKVNNSIGVFDNIVVYPADAISRADLVFPESYHEDVAEKGVGYPFGNVQYLGGNTDGLTGIANGAFTGFETYSLFGNWQTPSALIGKGYVWSNLTEAQKKAFIANPDNNCYLDGDKTIQVRHRVRVVQGIDDVGFSNPYNNYLTTQSGSYIKPKGKQVSIPSEFGIANSSGIYGHGTALWVSKIPYANELGAFSATSSYDSTTGFLTGSYNGECFALPLALVHRRNQGMYHNVFNPNGTKLASDGLDCFRTAVSFTSTMDCFDPAKLLTASGYIGTVSGRPDGLFYDQVHESDITDLRNSSKKVEDYNRLISREFNKLVGGTYRGKEAEWTTTTTFGTTNFLYDNGGVNVTIYDPNFLGASELSIGDTINVAYYNGSTFIYDRATVTISSNQALMVNAPNIAAAISGGVLKDGIKFCIYSKRTTRTKSNTLLHCDIIGNPANYPTAWKESGVFGTPLIVAEDGTSLLPDGIKDSFKLSRKANATPLLCLRSTDKGISWTSFTPTFSTTTNAITLTDEPAGNLVQVFYQTHTSMAIPAVNSEVLELGEVFACNGHPHSYLLNTLIGKSGVATGILASQFLGKISGYSFTTDAINSTSIYAPNNTPITLGASNPAVKVFPYLKRLNGKAYLNLVFKEMKHNGTSWGDSNTFNIVDNVSTTTDNNAQTILIGQKTVELNVFIGSDE